MEDRMTPGLWLEASDRPVADYAANRAPELAATPGVTRVTWWRSARPEGQELPMEKDDFGLLGVCETTDEFVAPAVPDDITALRFRRYPRPAQGRLTGRPTVGLLLVLISPAEPGRAQALRDWGDFVHLRHIAEAAVPGYTTMTPYERVDGDEPRFLHFYEMDTDDPQGAFETMTPLVAARLGADTEQYRSWAWTPDLRIWYVNTFRLVGELTADVRNNIWRQQK